LEEFVRGFRRILAKGQGSQFAVKRLEPKSKRRREVVAELEHGGAKSADQ